MLNQEINTALGIIRYLIADVNAKEIYARICVNNLSEWISVWQNSMNEQINNIKDALKNG